MKETKSSPDPVELRKFAFTLGCLIALLFGVLFPYFLERSYPVWPWVVMAVMLLLGMFLARFLGPLYRVWMLLGEKLGWINTRILLAIIFYFVVTPIGIVMRLTGKDALCLRLSSDQESYRAQSYHFLMGNLERPF